MLMAMAVNTLGLPAVALPVGITDGLPKAVQGDWPRYREDLCFDNAAAIEDQAGILTPIDPILSGVDGSFFSILPYRYQTLWAAILAHGFLNTVGMIAYFIAGPFYGLW